MGMLGMNLVTLKGAGKHELLFQNCPLCSLQSQFNTQARLKLHYKFQIKYITNLVTLKVGPKFQLLSNKPTPVGW
jgi:hypothetical protein